MPQNPNASLMLFQEKVNVLCEEKFLENGRPREFRVKQNAAIYLVS